MWYRDILYRVLGFQIWVRALYDFVIQGWSESTPKPCWGFERQLPLLANRKLGLTHTEKLSIGFCQPIAGPEVLELSSDRQRTVTVAICLRIAVVIELVEDLLELLHLCLGSPQRMCCRGEGKLTVYARDTVDARFGCLGKHLKAPEAAA